MARSPPIAGRHEYDGMRAVGTAAAIDGEGRVAFERGDIENPYQEQTDVNTDPKWLGDDRVEVDLRTMGDYAKGVQELQIQLVGRVMQLQPLLATQPLEAWKGHQILPEAALLAGIIANSTDEFNGYLLSLVQGLLNVGSAAQSIADIYAGTDGWSAADLGAVQWVLGEYGAKRPAGAPSWILDQTHAQAAAAGEGPPPPEDSGLWTVVSEGGYSGAFITVSAGPGGMRMVTVVVNDASGSSRTTTIYNAAGEQLTTRTQVTKTVYNGDTVTTRVTTTQDGKPQGSVETSETTTAGQVSSSTTTNTDANGKPSQQTVLRTLPDGSQIISTYEFDKDGNRIEPPIRVIAIGEQTAGPDRNAVDPGDTALDELRDEDDDRVPRFG